MSQFKACGKNNIALVPHHGVWRNNQQLALDIKLVLDIDSYKSKTQHILKVFECSAWRSRKKLSIFTSDPQLLDTVLVDESLMAGIQRIRYTSAQYEEETRKIDSIVTAVKLLRTKQPGREYEIQLSTALKHNKEHIKSLYAIIDANRTHVEITKRVENRLMEGRRTCYRQVFYCNNPEVIMMMRIVAPSVIHSVLKIVEKNSNED